jgi:hypothetical protein
MHRQLRGKDCFPLFFFFFFLFKKKMENNPFHHLDISARSSLSENREDGLDEAVDKRISLDPVVSDDLQRTHTEHALQLVEEVTGTDQRRRPSKAGVLSNLLKLDVFDPSDRRPVRPTLLRSLTSSQTLLQRMAPSVQDIEKADPRMAIASEIADILSRQDFILHLGKALVRTGALSHRIVSEPEA